MRGTLLAAVAAVAAATYGIDISAPIDSATAKCMVSNGRVFGVVRAWCSFGGFDDNAPGSVAALWDGGMAHVDVYMFPCAGQSPVNQANELVDTLSSKGVKFGMIWLDIESNPSPGCGWAAQTPHAVTGGLNETALQDGCSFITDLISTLKGRGINVGTYASEYEWSITVGSGCTAGDATPLWYAHYDGVPSFSDFTPFGGWTTPAIKQYSGTGSLCSFSIDSNWYP